MGEGIYHLDLVDYYMIFNLVGLKGEIEQEEQGPNRNTADFRIKKAQVCNSVH